MALGAMKCDNCPTEQPAGRETVIQATGVV